MPRKPTELKCITVGVTDRQTGEFHKWEDIQSNPELKKKVEDRVRSSMERTISMCPSFFR